MAFSEAGYKTLVCHDLYETNRVMIAPKKNSFFSAKPSPLLNRSPRLPLS